MVVELLENRVDIHIPSKAELATKSVLYQNLWDAILEDKWMWIVCWGKPRTGKTTIQLRCGFEIYQDWDLVLQAIVFNLDGMLYKMRKGEPCRLLTLNQLHWRVPILFPDDFGAQCNKAKTQHEPAWDIFKGAFDTLGTKVAILMASMGNPSGATQQIQEKYTHEIYVDRRGHAKFDVVDWQQNYAGWQSLQNKHWLEEAEFENVPKDVYKEYDEMRLGLVDELFQQIDDAQIENEGPKIFRRFTIEDVHFLELVQSKGQISNDWINKPENYKWKEVLRRCRSRGVITPVRHGKTYWYDITDFGYNMLDMIRQKQTEGASIPSAHAQGRATQPLMQDAQSENP